MQKVGIPMGPMGMHGNPMGMGIGVLWEWEWE